MLATRHPFAYPASSTQRRLLGIARWLILGPVTLAYFIFFLDLPSCLQRPRQSRPSLIRYKTSFQHPRSPPQWPLSFSASR